MKKINLLLGALAVGAAGVALADSLYVDATGNVGVGTNAPTHQVTVVGPTGAQETLYKLQQTDAIKTRFMFTNPNGSWTFEMTADAHAFQIVKVGTGPMLKVNDSGQLFVGGSATPMNNP